MKAEDGMRELFSMWGKSVCLVIVLAASEALASSESSRILTTALPGTSTVVVVAEGDHEPRSVGSYSVRAYAAVDPRFPYDHFISGIVRPRDGAVERILLSDLDRDGSPEIIVVVRSVGTGGYLSADAFRFDGVILSHVASVSGLSKGADPVQALEAKAAKGAESRSASPAGESPGRGRRP